MEIKINFDQLFTQQNQDLNTTLETPSHDHHNHSLNHSLNTTYDYKYTLDQNIFQHNQQQHPTQQDQEHQEDWLVLQPQRKVHKQSKQMGSEVGSRGSQPGQRLYYESQQQLIRKGKEVERMKEEKIMEITKSSTFVPIINEKSRLMAQKAKQLKKEDPKQKKESFKSSQQIKEEQQLKECTFKPTLIAKNSQAHAKSSEQLFFYLHNTNKMKDIKIKQKAEELHNNTNFNKKGTQAEVHQFLKRNQEFSTKVKEKQKLLIESSAEYDLNTGEKLFSPKIITNKAYNHHSITQVKPSAPQNTVKNLQKSHNIAEGYPQKIHQNWKEEPKMVKAGIFGKKVKEGSSIGIQLNYLKRQSQTSKQQQLKRIDYESKLLQKEIQDNYRQSSTNLQSKNLINENQSSYHHPPIMQEEELSMNSQDVEHLSIQQQMNSQGIQRKDSNQIDKCWADTDLKPIELSNVHKYLNASDQDQTQKNNNNYVIDILNNLLIKDQQQI